MDTQTRNNIEENTASRDFALKHGRKIRGKLIAAVLAAVLVVGAAAPAADLQAYAADTASETAAAAETRAPEKAETTITGYDTSINKLYRQTVTISVKVTPAYGRTVKLQRYSTKKKKWTTIKKLKTGSGRSEYANFSISRKYRARTTSKWRIYAPATDTAKSKKTKKITLIMRNVKPQKLSAKAACIYRIDGSGKGTRIYTKNSSARRAQASTTKLMTSILLIESGKLNGKTKISAHAVATPWASGHLEAGDVYRNKDLLYAMLLPSSNDAATAVAESVGGSEGAFVAKMNAKAAAMGLSNTQFRNPHGLDADGHYTTAVELAKLTAYAYNFPEIRQCWATNSKTITSLKLKKSWTLWSTNAIFSYVKNFLGGKTGTDDIAGCCFTGAYTYKGKTYVTVVLGSGGGFSRWADTEKLHRYIRKYAADKY